MYIIMDDHGWYIGSYTKLLIIQEKQQHNFKHVRLTIVAPEISINSNTADHGSLPLAIQHFHRLNWNQFFQSYDWGIEMDFLCNLFE